MNILLHLGLALLLAVALQTVTIHSDPAVKPLQHRNQVPSGAKKTQPHKTAKTLQLTWALHPKSSKGNPSSKTRAAAPPRGRKMSDASMRAPAHASDAELSKGSVRVLKDQILGKFPALSTRDLAGIQMGHITKKELTEHLESELPKDLVERDDLLRMIYAELDEEEDRKPDDRFVLFSPYEGPNAA